VITKLVPMGNGLGLVIDRALLERLGIDAETAVEVTTDGARIVVTPLPATRADLTEVARKVMCVHGETLKKLAE
jgi:antitoxin component of MazEF toxin-antitoxin module